MIRETAPGTAYAMLDRVVHAAVALERSPIPIPDEVMKEYGSAYMAVIKALTGMELPPSKSATTTDTNPPEAEK